MTSTPSAPPGAPPDPVNTPPQAPPSKAPDPIRSGFDRIVVAAARGAAWLVFIAMAISVFEVIMRYGFDSPTS
ncbi:TRAP transporter small permease subunit, partial [Halomonas sp. V046]